jgi:hypothetical protein
LTVEAISANTTRELVCVGIADERVVEYGAIDDLDVPDHVTGSITT